jgi:chromate reductase
MSTRIAVIVGSIRKSSFNLQLSKALTSLAPNGVIFEQLRIDDLPLYNQDDDASPSETVIRFKNAVLASTGVLFVTPEYNRSIPGVLKNAIDHASRPYGKSAWTAKPAAITGISVGPIGTACAQQHLRTILAYLDMNTMGQPEVFLANKPGFFDDSGALGNEETRKFLQAWTDRFVGFVQRNAVQQSS